MEAGRELDRLVAERVMGFEVSSEGGYVRLHRNNTWQRISSYSTDIAAAMQVVEKLSTRAYLQLHSPFIPDEKWWAFFEHLGTTDTHPIWRGIGTTAAEAICRAAVMYAVDPDNQ